MRGTVTPEDIDELNKRVVCECDCDLDTTGVSSPKKLFIVRGKSRDTENKNRESCRLGRLLLKDLYVFVYYESITRELNKRLICVMSD